MPLDVLQDYNEATVTTSLNGTDAAGTSESITVSAVLSAWTALTGSTQMRVMDKADLSLPSGYEIMILTADNAGAAGTWTLTRGAEGSTVHVHTASWTLVPTNTAAGLLNSLVPLSTVTTKGDLLVATALGAVTRLGVGVDGTVLTADSSQASGVKWGLNIVAGAFTVTFSASSQATSPTVSYGITFAAAPIVVVTCGAITANTVVSFSLTSRTTTTFAGLARLDSGASTSSSITCTYIAIGN